MSLHPGQRGHVVILLVEDVPAFLVITSMMMGVLGVFSVLAATTPGVASVCQGTVGEITALDVVIFAGNVRPRSGKKLLSLYPR